MKRAILVILLFVIVSSLGANAYAADKQQLDWEKTLLFSEQSTLIIKNQADRDIYEFFVADFIRDSSGQRYREFGAVQALIHCNRMDVSVADVLAAIEKNTRIRKDIRPVVPCIKDFATNPDTSSQTAAGGNKMRRLTAEEIEKNLIQSFKGNPTLKFLKLTAQDRQPNYNKFFLHEAIFDESVIKNSKDVINARKAIDNYARVYNNIIYEDSTFRTKAVHLILNMDPNTRAGLKAVYYCSKQMTDENPFDILMEKTNRHNIETGLSKKIETGIICVDEKKAEDEKKEAYMKLRFGLRTPVISQIIYESSNYLEKRTEILKRYAIILEEVESLELKYINLKQGEVLGEKHKPVQLINSPDDVLSLESPMHQMVLLDLQMKLIGLRNLKTISMKEFESGILGLKNCGVGFVKGFASLEGISQNIGFIAAGFGVTYLAGMGSAATTGADIAVHVAGGVFVPMEAFDLKTQWNQLNLVDKIDRSCAMAIQLSTMAAGLKQTHLAIKGFRLRQSIANSASKYPSAMTVIKSGDAIPISKYRVTDISKAMKKFDKKTWKPENQPAPKEPVKSEIDVFIENNIRPENHAKLKKIASDIKYDKMDDGQKAEFRKFSEEYNRGGQDAVEKYLLKNLKEIDDKIYEVVKKSEKAQSLKKAEIDIKNQITRKQARIAELEKQIKIDEEIAKKIEEQIRNADDAVVLEQLKNLKKKTEDSIAASRTEKTNALNELSGFESDITKNINERTVLEAEALAGYDKLKSDGIYEKQETLSSVSKQAVLRSNTKPKDWQRSKYVYNAAMKTVSYDNYRDLTDIVVLEELKSDRFASDLKRGTRSTDGFRNSLVDDPNGELKIFFEKLDAGVLHDVMNEAIDNAGIDRSKITSASISAEQLGRGESATVFSVDIGEQHLVLKKIFMDPENYEYLLYASEKGAVPKVYNAELKQINEVSREYLRYLEAYQQYSIRADHIRIAGQKESFFMQKKIDGVELAKFAETGFTEKQVFETYGKERAEFFTKLSRRASKDELTSITDGDWNLDNYMIDKQGKVWYADQGLDASTFDIATNSVFTLKLDLNRIFKSQKISDPVKASEYALDGMVNEFAGRFPNGDKIAMSILKRENVASIGYKRVFGIDQRLDSVISDYLARKGFTEADVVPDDVILDTIFGPVP
ncbi:MAG: hypothetical protein HZB65_03025 [Candidatus Aenigmarchaeota archaeon]|nr:hypothetical protein [Candidatus Aenigmarchaeota archaeon]